MAILDVLVYPDPALRAMAEEVTVFDGKLKKLVSDMYETMYLSKGVGLAAPQAGIPIRLVVIDWEGARYALVNPRITEAEGAERAEEGCLSFPGIYEEIERPSKIRVAYQDEDGAPHDTVIEGFLARVFCHEIDHLEATLMIDRLSRLKQAFIKKKMERKAKAAAATGERER
ncbi:MAG: peptide deformylase [Synergistaceae bacterium]|jgi:peptide deformylase|nr:peptide deformylase [Synergistaceae bacterium]